MTPRYPVYVISKSRATCCLTARFLVQDKVPFRLVIEPQEQEAYAAHFDPACLAVLPFSNLGQGSTPARNWCWEHAKETGAERHWILDDNIYHVERFLNGARIRCDSGIALSAVETLVDRYENIGIGGLNYTKFAIPNKERPPLYLNVHVYSCLLIRNDLSYRWRCRYNEDTDLCLQVLSGGWCTVLTNAFLIQKVATMKMKGGNTDVLYRGNGRLTMARSLERQWPGVVTVKRRFSRAQHYIKDNWKYFDTPLRLKADAPPVDPEAYRMTLTELKPVQSRTLNELVGDVKGRTV